MYCFDASIIVSANIVTEPYHLQSKNFLNLIKDSGIVVFMPEIVFPEVMTGIIRGTNSPQMARDFAVWLRKISSFNFIPVDKRISNIATEIVIDCRLKSSDAIYVAVASFFQVKLVTLDKEQKEKGAKCVETATTEEELRKWK